MLKMYIVVFLIIWLSAVTWIISVYYRNYLYNKDLTDALRNPGDQALENVMGHEEFLAKFHRAVSYSYRRLYNLYVISRESGRVSGERLEEYRRFIERLGVVL